MSRQRNSIPRAQFSPHFNNLKSQIYNDHIASQSRSGVPTSSIRSISWNPTGNLVATGSSDKSVRVWNPEKPHVRFSTELKGHVAPVEKVVFNPVKDSELASMSTDGVVKVWDARGKSCLNEVKGLGDASTLAWAPDGESILVGNKAAVLFILSPTQPTPVSSHQQESPFNHVTFCFSGQRIFVALESGQVRVLGYPSLEPLLHHPFRDGGSPPKEFTLNGHAWSCLSVELQPTAQFLATGGADSLIALWDTSEWLCLRTGTTMTGAVRSLSFTFDGLYLAAGSDECANIQVVCFESGELVHTFRTAGPSPIVAWAPTRYCLAYSDSGVLRIIGMDDRK